MKIQIVALGLMIVLSTACASNEGENMPDNVDFYSLSSLNIQGKMVNFDDFRGKVVIVVNTASNCGFTPQYTELEALYQRYKEQGLVILGFPCNQFANQEAGTNQAIAEFCSINYGVTFQLFEKVDVNGAQASQVFTWLKNKAPGLMGKDIAWNFTKFLINRDASQVVRFAPGTAPSKMTKEIEKLL